jgi:hypothetical protein
LLTRSPRSTVLHVPTCELRKGQGFKKELKSLSSRSKKSSVVVFLFWTISTCVHSVLPFLASFIESVYALLYSRKRIKNASNRRTWRTLFIPQQEQT